MAHVNSPQSVTLYPNVIEVFQKFGKATASAPHQHQSPYVVFTLCSQWAQAPGTDTVHTSAWLPPMPTSQCPGFGKTPGPATQNYCYSDPGFMSIFYSQCFG